MKIVFMALAAICGLAANAQKHIELHTLKVGDTIPEFLPVGKMVNNIETYTTFKDLRGKAILIDFWATWCVPCIRELPKLDSMQKEFAKDLVILPVSAKKSGTLTKHEETAADIDRFLKARKLNLHASTEDTLLWRLFPHQTIPHEIWIDKNGIVRSITSHEELTWDNMKQFILFAKPPIRQKKDDMDFDWTKPLGGLEIAEDEVLYRSTLLKYKPNIGGGMHVYRDSIQNVKRIYDHNGAIGHLFTEAYALGKFSGFNNRRTVLDVTDSTKYFIKPKSFPHLNWKNRDDWANDIFVTYELSFAKALPDSAFFEYMLQDLNRIFPLKGKIENKEIPCLVLVVKDRNKLQPSKYKEPFSATEKNSFRFQRKTISFMLWRLSMFKNSPPIIDETNYKDSTDMIIDFSESEYIGTDRGLVIAYEIDVPILRKQLEKYGLDIIEDKRVLPVLYLSDKPEIYKKWGIRSIN